VGDCLPDHHTHKAASRSARDLEHLLAERAEAYRLGSAPISELSVLETWLEERGLALASGQSALPSAAEAIAGGPIAGSWWGHAEGPRIYRLLGELEAQSSGLIELSLVEGKRTLLSSRLTPLLEVVAADPGRRERVVAGLRPPARELLEHLDPRTALRSDDASFATWDNKSWRAARNALEAGLLARSSSIHTESGRHVSVLEAYPPPSSRRPRTARQTSSGLGELLAAALDACIVARQSEVVRWLRFVEPDRGRRSAALDGIGARPLVVAGQLWLTRRDPPASSP
jgi:hypothetical protein